MIASEQRLLVTIIDRASFCHNRGALQGLKAIFSARNWVFRSRLYA
jgi:hypothetical protein